jgi:P4 family phage/plasmid primase-like protien
VLHEAVHDPHRLARVYLEQYGFNAQKLKTLYFWRGEWWRYDKNRYRVVRAQELRAVVTRTVKYALDDSAQKTGDKPFKVTTSLISNVIQALESLRFLSDDLDQPTYLRGGSPRLLAVRNGLIDLVQAVKGITSIQPHTPDWFSPNCFPVDFDSAATCPKWDAFLRQVLEDDEERIDLLQEMMGYLLVPDTRQHKLFMLEGPGGNGKSVVQQTMISLLGDDQVSHVPLAAFHQRFALTPTVGKLANIVSELGSLSKDAEDMIKAFVSGDKLTIDRKHISAIHVRPTARIVVATNNRPQFDDRSDGIWRRVILFPFQVTIPEAQQNKRLAEELRSELPGILNFALKGLWRLHLQGRFTEPALCRQIQAQYRLESNPTRVFLNENCVEDPQSSETCESVYKQYVGWAKTHGYRPLDDTQFGKELKRVFPRVRKGRPSGDGARYYTYEGLKLSNVSTVSDELVSVPDVNDLN